MRDLFPRCLRILMFAGVILLLTLQLSIESYAFPEMQRHGYINCTTCHVSPNGGGALTEYGRALITEALSTWGNEKEAQIAYFVQSKPSWLDLGGDIRYLYLYRNNPSVREGKWIFMQADLETRVRTGAISVGGTLGLEEIRSDSGAKTYSVHSRQHYLLWQIDEKLATRVGRFHTAYGINIPDHFSSIKRGLGFDQNEENYNIELSYIGDSWSHFATLFLGQPERTVQQQESGFSARTTFAPTEKIKVGLSMYKAQNLSERRFLFGPSAVIGFSEYLFLISEFDFQYTTTKASGERVRGFYSYQKLGYELTKGLILYFAQENQYANVRSSSSHAYSHSIGAQWFPRPHFEFQLNFGKMKSSQFERKYTDQGWFLVHFYL